MLCYFTLAPSSMFVREFMSVVAFLWWYMWCVYVICTRVWEEDPISTLHQSLWEDSCLNVWHLFLVCLFFSCISVLLHFDFYFLLFYASNPLQPPAIPPCLAFLALTHVLLFRPPPSLFFPGIFLLSWNRCPLINKDLVYHSNEVVSKCAQKRGGEEEYRKIIFNMHVWMLCYKPGHTVLQH